MPAVRSTSKTVTGKIDSSQSEVLGYPRRVVAGNWMRCQVVLRDQFGNPATYQPLSGNGFKFFAEATGPSAISGDVLDTGEGTRDIAFPFTTLGTYTVTIEGEDGAQARTPVTSVTSVVLTLHPVIMEGEDGERTGHRRARRHLRMLT